MTDRKSRKVPGGALDRVGREVVRAASAGEAEADAVAAAPFLYARLRSRIAAEQARRERERWPAALAVVWRAVPALALVAVIAFVLAIGLGRGAGAGRGLTAGTFLSPDDVGVEDVMFAEGRPMSSEDVLATILGERRREARDERAR
jgi:hypothetical protein